MTSPKYFAVILWVPILRFEIFKLAVLELGFPDTGTMETVPKTVVPSKKVIDPVGGKGGDNVDPVTLALKITVSPN